MEKNVDNLVKATNSITSSFKSLRFVVISCLVGAFVAAVLCVYLSTSAISGLGDTIYVLDDKGQVLSAGRQNVQTSRRDEIIDQATRFHELFFNVSPNRDIVRINLERALEISDKSVYNYYTDLNEKGFYRRLQQTNSSQQIVVDSVKVDMRQTPFTVVTYASQFITRESNITRFSLITRCNMIDVKRNPKNLHGLQIEKFEVLENNQIEQRKR